MHTPKNHKAYLHAYLSRDVRFDGKFFTGVRTTGIYCRPICPAKSPKEENVTFFDHAHLAAKAGYRPCLRCHPDSAPGSPIWNGVTTTLKRAKQLIDEGALEQGSLKDLSTRLGISDRYLRQLFNKHLGIPPKAYALFRQCEFAKNLLHQTQLPITDIALASGFKSIRRFNDCFKMQFLLNPTDVRKKKTSMADHFIGNSIELKLYFRPPYHWPHLQSFYAFRLIEGLEWTDKNSYGRTFKWGDGEQQCKGQFTATYNEERHRFDVKIEIDKVCHLKGVVNNIRRVLDLDSDSKTIEQCLSTGGFSGLEKGMRLPGTWSVFEAGIRAILGQQISVVAACNLLKSVVTELGENVSGGIGMDQDKNMDKNINKNNETINKIYFPSIQSMAESNFDFLKMPGARKQTLITLALHFLNEKHPHNPDTWLPLKGIGPWTVDYAKMRGLSNPDIYLGGDLGVKKAMEKTGSKINPEKMSPFRSYLTFQLWNLL